MLYHLLYPLSSKWAALNVFRYPSFRTLMAFMFALVLGVYIGPRVISALRRLQNGQSNVREDTPETHQKKAGTPTMGGGIILLCTALATLLFADLTNRYVWTALVVFLGYGAIGFADDYLKIARKNSKGLAGRYKIAGQTVILFVSLVAFNSTFEGGFRLTMGTTLSLPFIATNVFNPDIGWFYLALAWVVVVGTSNAVNLTDGLDGLAIGPSIVSSITFLVLAYLAGSTLVVPKSGVLIPLADYLYIPHIPQAAELAVFAASLAGAGMAFLWFNAYPASVFMGDLGALAIGGALGTLALLTKNEAVSAILHGVFLVEALSVMIQVFWFKRTGTRVFLRAPIHHHFELKGWAEPKIIVRFWIVSILLAGMALASLKLR